MSQSVMENSNEVVPPHLNAEVYRTNTNGNDVMCHLDYIQLHKDGTVLIGSSELTGRYWNGGINIFNNIDDIKSREHNKKSIDLTSGTAAGCFIDNSTKLLICEDSGVVSVWGRSTDAWQPWSLELTVAEHDDGVLALDCLQSGKEYITAGADGNVKVWDVAEMICVRNYLSAHDMGIYDISVKPKSTTCFATGSLDQCVTLWDENISKPALDLIRNNCGIRCLQWVDENQLVYGDEAGVLRLLDIRNTASVHELHQFPASVHRVAVHPESKKVAVCCDNKVLSVCDIGDNNNSTVVYSDRTSHSNYVRGVAWDVTNRGVLHSVGWDGQFTTHTIDKHKL